MLHCVAPCDRASQCSLASIIVIYAPALSSVCMLFEWHISCAPSDLMCPWHTDILVPPCTSAAVSYTHTHSQRHVSLHLQMLKAKWDIKHSSQSRKNTWEQEGGTEKYTTKEKLGHQMPLFFETGSGDTFFSLCWFCPCCRMPWIRGLYSHRRTILASLNQWALCGTMNLMTRRMEMGERPGQIAEYIWNFDLFSLGQDAYSFEGNERHCNFYTKKQDA